MIESGANVEFIECCDQQGSPHIRLVWDTHPDSRDVFFMQCGHFCQKFVKHHQCCRCSRTAPCALETSRYATT